MVGCSSPVSTRLEPLMSDISVHETGGERYNYEFIIIEVQIYKNDLNFPQLIRHTTCILYCFDMQYRLNIGQ